MSDRKSMKRTMNHCSHRECRTEAFTAGERTRACIVGMCVLLVILFMRFYTCVRLCMCVWQWVRSGGCHETEDLDWKTGLLL